LNHGKLSADQSTSIAEINFKLHNERAFFSARQFGWRASAKFPDRHKNDNRLLDDVIIGRAESGAGTSAR
jgi:hypothetical protein